ncbi:serine hydrolase [Flavobacterium frigidarium]|jgi:CubicO group peptidase (beta-lactamase class C family)|uniref:Serine hydrolase n=1 Tax=Flavobacterium frigidarium TaxID=99286 RepID=A0ABV4KB45_9FLAO
MKIIKTPFRIKKISGFAILCLLLTTANGFSQTKAEKIDQLMTKYHEYNQFNGTLLVAENGATIYKKGFGLANMEWDMPNQVNTVFRIGSITKQFTSMLIMQLVAQGKLKLDVPISSYLPDYPKNTGAIITVHHLLTHTSGIPNYTSFSNFQKEIANHSYTSDEFIKLFMNRPLDFTPGERLAYSNSGYFLLGHIIEKITGKTYGQCLKESILDSLQMTHTAYDKNDLIVKNRASGYEKDFDRFKKALFTDMSVPFAAGGMYTTVEDLQLWDEALYTEKLLPKKFKDSLFNTYATFRNIKYGYGWFIREIPNLKEQPLKVVEHGGGIEGFNSLISRIPEDKNLTLLLNNTGNTVLEEISTAIRAILYDKPYKLPQPSLATTILNLIHKNDIETAFTKLEALKKVDTYAIAESDINDAGYQLLQDGKIKEAIAVFKINTANFETSSNVFDSLAEASVADKNTEAAIENYKKAVQLNPSNVHAKEELAKLQNNKK